MEENARVKEIRKVIAIKHAWDIRSKTEVIIRDQ
jgi:hypothetical protein